MAEILRPNFDKLWASAGSVIEPSELKIESGWMEEVPPSQWENWIQLRQDQAIKYIFQRGIPAWDAKEEYFAGRSAVLLDGDIYIALRNNVNKSPKTNAADWRVVTKDLTIANITGLQTALNNKADKTVRITAGDGLTGGGTLAANRTIELNGATKNSLTLADGALQKTQNLNDLPNKATARNNLGLGTAATRNVGKASGNLMEVGAFGLGVKSPKSFVGSSYEEQLTINLEVKMRATGEKPQDSPESSATKAFAVGHIGSWETHLAFGAYNENFYIRSRKSFSGEFRPWQKIFHTGNFNPDSKANTTTQIIAGNGLSGGGNLTTNRTLTLGTPSSVTKTSTNSVTATSHTHELGADVKNSLSLADSSLQKAQNLNDLPNVSAARNNLGLGSAATKDVGTTEDTVAAGDDSRITGALQKSSNLSDVENKTTARSNLGLGSAATRGITTSATDTTAGRVTTVGWMGLGGAIVVNSDIDWDTLQNSGFYSILTEEGSNRPTTRWGSLIVSGNASRSSQIYITDDSAQMYIRSKGSGSTSWSPWRETLHTDIFPPIGYCYTQYPSTPSPSELFGGTWTLMFNTEGVFFRTEGGSASSFGGGIQSDALQNITGDFFGAGLSSNPTGVFSRTTGLSGVRGDGADGARVSFDASRVARTSTETRPRNRTVRVWRKTAH